MNFCSSYNLPIIFVFDMPFQKPLVPHLKRLCINAFRTACPVLLGTETSKATVIHWNSPARRSSPFGGDEPGEPFPTGLFKVPFGVPTNSWFQHLKICLDSL